MVDTARARHLQRFADELDEIARRSDIEGPASEAEVAAIFAEHEAECAALKRAEDDADAEQGRAGRRA